MPKPGDRDPDYNLFRRGQTWWCRYVLAGTQRWVSLRTTDVKAARRARDRLLKEAAGLREGHGPVVVRKWEDAVEAFLTMQETLVRGRALSTRTASRYESSIVQISEALEGIPLADITSATVLDYVVARREEGRSASTIRNDLTAWSRVMNVAEAYRWVDGNPARVFDRRTFIGRDADLLVPPTDAQVHRLIEEIGTWASDMADLVRWLRETGMRLAEALHIRRADAHTDGLHATLRQGVKRNRGGLKTRTIHLGRAAALLARMPKEGRLFAPLPTDSAAVSTRYGQWCRQQQARENCSATIWMRARIASPDLLLSWGRCLT